MKTIRKIILALVIATISSSVLAAAPPISTTSNFQSSATLNATCQVSVNPLSFGAITPNSAEVQVTGTLKLRCSKEIIATIAMSGGNSGDYFNRYMIGNSGNTDRLKYNIYESMEQVWGQGASAAYNMDYGQEYMLGLEQIIPIVGKIEANQYIKPDTYTDSLTVMIDY